MSNPKDFGASRALADVVNIGVQPVLSGKLGSAAPASSLGLPAQKSSSPGPGGFGTLLEDASISQPTANTVSSSALERSAETKSYGATKGKCDRDQAQSAASPGISADLASLPVVQNVPLTSVISTLSLAASPSSSSGGAVDGAMLGDASSGVTSLSPDGSALANQLDTGAGLASSSDSPAPLGSSSSVTQLTAQASRDLPQALLSPVSHRGTGARIAPGFSSPAVSVAKAQDLAVSSATETKTMTHGKPLPYAEAALPQAGIEQPATGSSPATLAYGSHKDQAPASAGSTGVAHVNQVSSSSADGTIAGTALSGSSTGNKSLSQEGSSAFSQSGAQDTPASGNSKANTLAGGGRPEGQGDDAPLLQVGQLIAPALHSTAESSASLQSPLLQSGASTGAQSALGSSGTREIVAGSSGADAAAMPAAIGPSINSSRILSNMEGTEMRVGMHSAEFGTISVSTTVTQSGVAAQIALDHGGLSRALSAHVPDAEAKLGSALGLPARIDLRDTGTNTAQRDSSQAGGSAAEQASSQASSQRGFAVAPTQQSHAAYEETDWKPGPAESFASSRLNVHG